MYEAATTTTCIVCEEHIGMFQTLDGPVCPYCMPKELVSQATSLKKHNILLYQKSHPNWESCANSPQFCNNSVEDRSTAITRNTGIVLADELNAQIEKADSIDIVVSFIKLSGLSLLLKELTKFSQHGKLRVITTAYMGATEYEALNEIFKLPNTEVRMELNTESTKLHAKTFLFNKSNGNSVAFVGSANISKTALTQGEEWVVKLLEKDVPDVIQELHMSYENLWNSRTIKPVNQRNRSEIEFALERRGS